MPRQSELVENYSESNIDFQYYKKDRPLTKYQFSHVNAKRHPNAEGTKSLDSLASDQKSYTGPEQGFFAKFGSDKTE